MSYPSGGIEAIFVSLHNIPYATHYPYIYLFIYYQ